MDNEFQNIKNEAIRQLQAIEDGFRSNDRKIEVIFGVALTIFGYIFSQQSFLSIFTSSNYPLIVFFITGLLLVLYSVYLGYHQYKPRWHAIGPSTEEMYKQAQTGDKRIEETLLHNINSAIKFNQPLQEKKWKSVNSALKSLAIGVLALVIARLLFFFSTYQHIS